MRAGIYDKYNTREGEREKGNFQDVFLPLTLKPGDLGKITSTSHNKTFNSHYKNENVLLTCPFFKIKIRLYS